MNTKDAATDTPASAVAEPAERAALLYYLDQMANSVIGSPDKKAIYAEILAAIRSDMAEIERLRAAATAPPPIARSAADAYSPEMRELASRAIESNKVPEDIDAWAERLSASVYAAPVGSQQSGSGEATVSDAMCRRFMEVGLRNVDLVNERGPRLSDVRQGLEAAIALAAQKSPPASGVCSGGKYPYMECYRVGFGQPCADCLRYQRALAASSDTQAQK